MIWITTLLMLGLAAWFIRQGLAEKRLYLEQNPDAGQVADEGLFMDAVKRVAPARNDAAPRLEEETSLFASLARKVQGADSPLSRLMDRKSKEATATDSDGDGVFDRTVNSMRKRMENPDNGIEKMRARVGSSNGDDGLLSRLSQKLVRADEKIDAHVARKADRLDNDDNSPLINPDSTMGRIVGSVGRKLDNFDDRVERKLDRVRESAADDNAQDDLITRYASRIGPRMDALDDKLVDATRKVSDRLSRDRNADQAGS